MWTAHQNEHRMSLIVTEHLDTFPFDTPAVVLRRREDLLLSEPIERQGRKFRAQAPIGVSSFSVQ